jgi:hypothetical protein
MADRGALATLPALVSPVDRVDPAVVTTPVDLVDQAAEAAVAAEAVAGDATWLGVHGRSQRQQPRRCPQVLLPEATF